MLFYNGNVSFPHPFIVSLEKGEHEAEDAAHDSDEPQSHDYFRFFPTPILQI